MAAGVYAERITLPNSVALYGGFAGTETTRVQRNIVANLTVLDGGKGGAVVESYFGTPATRIDGFTVRNGEGPKKGGILCVSSSPTIVNNIITLNIAQGALGLWGNVLGESDAGETVMVDAQFDNLGGSANSAVLGFASPLSSNFVSGDPLGANVFFAGALVNHLSGSDQSAGSEVNSVFNSDVDGSTVLGNITWYYGTDGNAPPQAIDFVETALHEIAHGLGFAGTLTSDGVDLASYLNVGLINSYDYFVVRDSDSAPLFSLSDQDRYDAITGADISWAGAAGIAANGGTRPLLYAPSTFASGSTSSHLEENTYPTELMSPFATSGTGHTLSGLTPGILQDQGWTILAVPEPGSLILLGIGALCLARLRRRS